MKLRVQLTPQWRQQRGPYWRQDRRARLRRLAEGWMPLILHTQFRRIELSIRFREPLGVVPKVGLPLHTAWFTQADMDWSNEVARELGAELKARGGSR